MLVYVGLFSPFATLLMRSFMLTLPKEFEEAARVDGAGEALKVLSSRRAPERLPGLLTIALVTGLSAYNEFLFAITFIQDSDLLPVSTTFFSFQQGFTQDFTLISAAGIIMIAPMLVPSAPDAVHRRPVVLRAGWCQRLVHGADPDENGWICAP